ncbi:DUF2252 domain-containing protein [Ralstonia pickettii]|uniref:DUF2252 family protein n=1 Tax=Ralstonia pickettii TaxID=329 RepID=UPI0027153363|nr:DUF2252 family protein [Ralstonia pickettii]WKZ86474.1 DUF2252 domain-containing protein [Ralstonia pickettii]
MPTVFRAPTAVRPKDRGPILNRLRQSKMTRSTHAYVRGSTTQFYAWLAQVQPSTFPEGPTIWICGDCHVGNLGPIGDLTGQTSIQVRDLDQAVLGNPAHDLIRLGLSLATAARGSDLPGIVTAQMVEALMAGYLRGIDPDAALRLPKRPAPVHTAMKAATARTWEQLAAERLDGSSPNIPRGRHFWSLSSDERRELKKLIGAHEAIALVARLYEVPGQTRARLIDAAYWVKGCSSLGQRRYALLVEIESSERDGAQLYRLLDLKEAGPPAAPSSDRSAMPRHNGERVVTAAQHLSPALGERMAWTRMLGGSFFLRELMPQDLKLSIDRLTQSEAGRLASYLGNVLGIAHGRQMDRDTASAWHRELKSRHGRSIDAPFWLWSSIVDLIGLHERQYLEHCRNWGRQEA